MSLYGKGTKGGGNSPFTTYFPTEVVGLEAWMCPFPEKNAGQRTMMLASHIWQAQEVIGANFPRISTGGEQQFMEYVANTSKREGDVILFDSIPKFIVNAHGFKTNPCTYVFFTRGNQADYVTVEDYVKLYNGFGVENVHTNDFFLLNLGRGTPLPEEAVLTKPNNLTDRTMVDGDNLYCQGVNAQVAYMTIPQVAEDSMIVSESFANKCQHKAIQTFKITIPRDRIPLNLYGDVDTPKCFPDIGEIVREDGILLAMREATSSGFAALMAAPLNKVLINDDIICCAQAGATVIDVDVQFDARYFRELESDPKLLTQPIQYQQQHHRFYQRVIKVYEDLVKGGYSLSPKLNDLITRALVLGKHKDRIPIIEGRDPVDGCIVEITCMYSRDIGAGFKSTGRYGDKGVFSTVWPDDWMPTDEFGIRADIIRSPNTVGSRSNPGQLYEQSYLRMASLVHRRLVQGLYGEGLQAYKKCIEFISDVHTNYATELASLHYTKELKLSFLEAIKREGFYFIIPPACVDSTLDRVNAMMAKWEYVKTRVTYKYETNGRVRTFKTVQPITIGEIYIYLLGKIPKHQLSAHQMTHTNQINIPIKTSDKSIDMQYNTKATPIRFGEDEMRLISMMRRVDEVDVEPNDETARFMLMRAGCAKAAELLGHMLLTEPKPTAISEIPMSTDQMVENSDTIRLFNSMMGVVGVDLSTTSAGRRPITEVGETNEQ